MRDKLNIVDFKLNNFLLGFAGHGFVTIVIKYCMALVFYIFKPAVNAKKNATVDVNKGKT